MRVNWVISEVFNDDKTLPKTLVMSTGKEMCIEVRRRTLCDTWYVTCDLLSMHDVKIEEKNIGKVTAKAIMMVYNRINEVISSMRNLIYEIMPTPSLDQWVSPFAMKWVKYDQSGYCLEPESGELVIYESRSYGKPFYEVGTYFKKGDYLDDELPVSDGNFLEQLIRGTGEKSERLAEESGFYTYDVNRDTGLCQWKIDKMGEVVAWASLKPSEEIENEDKDTEYTK